MTAVYYLIDLEEGSINDITLQSQEYSCFEQEQCYN